MRIEFDDCIDGGGMKTNMIGFLMIAEDEKIRNKLEELYFLYRKDMFFAAYDILKDYHEAEDAVQSSIIKLSSIIEKIETVKCNKTRAFVVIVVRNISLNIYKQRKREKLIPPDNFEEILFHEDFSLQPQIIRLEQAEEIAKLLAKLNGSYADILTLKYYYEYSNSEIAELINTTEGNVRIKIYRAQQALKKLLTEDGGVLNE